MTGFIEDTIMRSEGLTDQDIADINTALPDIQALDATLVAQWPRINKVLPLILRLAGKIAAKQRTLP
jgi:hypothetical protein